MDGLPKFISFPIVMFRYVSLGASQMALVVKNLPTNARDRRHRFNPWDRKIPWRRKWQPTPVCSHNKNTPDGVSRPSDGLTHQWSLIVGY